MVNRSLGLNSIYERKCIGPNRDPLPYICKCRRHDFFVSFKDLGWERMVISPQIFNAYKCMGDCHLKTYINQKVRPAPNNYIDQTVHSWFRGALNLRHPELYGEQQMSNCVPIQLKPLVVMFYVGGKRIIEVFNDAIVEKCGCR